MTAYSSGFEVFWKEWCGITNRRQDKPEAFGHWKAKKLEGKESELIETLKLQHAERESDRKKKLFVPEWCWCRKWISKGRYEYRPEKRIAVKRTYIPPVEQSIQSASPESVKQILENAAKSGNWFAQKMMNRKCPTK